METAINEFEIEADYSIPRVEAILHLIIECLTELKISVQKTEFANKDKEIHFLNTKNQLLYQNLFTSTLFTK